VSARLSVVLTTLNEELNIERCLNSVRWADEIVVVDSFSRDRTVQLARSYTDRVYQHEFPGSSRQVERGISYATGEWVFLIDADEEVSPELAREVQTVLRAESSAGEGLAGYDILRKSKAFGRWIESGGWYPDYQFRFFRKDGYTAEHQEVHGGFAPSGKRGRLAGPLYHYTYDNIYSYVAKMNDYTSLQVSNKLKADPLCRARKRNLILNPLSHFLRMYVSRKGYRDGFHGFVLAMLDAAYTMVLYAKLWEHRMHEEQGTGYRPPITNAELNRLKHRS
jgi:glycosyltransferase involved in cell wall biosynthesis